MATTSNYGWPTPDDSDSVSQGAAAIRSLGSAIDATVYTQGTAITALDATVTANGTAITGLDATVTANGTAITGLQSDITTKVSKTDVSGNVFVVVGERQNVPSVGDSYSFGNGAADQNAALPYACSLIAMASVGGPVHTGTTTAQIRKNGTLQGSTYQISYTGTASSTATFGTALTFAAGDTVNAEVTAAGAGYGGAVTFVFRID